MLENFSFYNLPRKSIPGVVLAHGLLLGVFRSGLGPDFLGCLETPSNDQYYYA